MPCGSSSIVSPGPYWPSPSPGPWAISWDTSWFFRYDTFWKQTRPYSGGLNSIISIVVASITLFFHNSQKLYRRMKADHHRMAETSQEILTLNREMEALVMERTMSEMALGIADGIRNPLLIIGGFRPSVAEEDRS